MMKRFSTLCASLTAICLCGAINAQCLTPGTEDFDALPQSSNSYGILSPATLPTGWTHDLTALNSWRVDAGGTTVIDWKGDPRRLQVKGTGRGNSWTAGTAWEDPHLAIGDYNSIFEISSLTLTPDPKHGVRE